MTSRVLLSIRVEATPARAFEVFTGEIGAGGIAGAVQAATEPSAQPNARMRAAPTAGPSIAARLLSPSVIGGALFLIVLLFLVGLL